MSLGLRLSNNAHNVFYKMEPFETNGQNVLVGLLTTDRQLYMRLIPEPECQANTQRNSSDTYDQYVIRTENVICYLETFCKDNDLTNISRKAVFIIINYFAKATTHLDSCRHCRAAYFRSVEDALAGCANRYRSLTSPTSVSYLVPINWTIDRSASSIRHMSRFLRAYPNLRRKLL